MKSILRFLTNLFQKQKPTEDELAGAIEGCLIEEFKLRGKGE